MNGKTLYRLQIRTHHRPAVCRADKLGQKNSDKNPLQMKQPEASEDLK